MNKELLNGVQEMLINFANKNGIVLTEQFGTVEQFKVFVINFTIKSIMDLAKEMGTELEFNKVYDMVLGDGAYVQLANQVWESLQVAAQ